MSNEILLTNIKRRGWEIGFLYWKDKNSFSFKHWREKNRRANCRTWSIKSIPSLLCLTWAWATKNQENFALAIGDQYSVGPVLEHQFTLGLGQNLDVKNLFKVQTPILFRREKSPIVQFIKFPQYFVSRKGKMVTLNTKLISRFMVVLPFTCLQG